MVPLFVLAHFGHHLVIALMQPLSPFIRDEFGISYEQVAWLLSSFTLAYGISQIPAGWLADRIGPRILIMVGTSGVAACGLLAGISPTYAIMIIPLMLMGILGGSYHPAASPLVSSTVEDRNRGRALGLHQIGGSGSYFLTPLIAVGTAAIFGGWRGSFISMSILTILLGIGLYIILGRRGYAGGPRANTPGSEPVSTYTAVPKRKLVAFILLGVILQVSIFSTMSFLSLFAVDTFEFSEEAAAALLTLANIGGLWAGPVGGYLSDRIGKIPVMLVVCLLAGPFIYLLSLVNPGWSITMVLLAFGTIMYIGMPVTEAYVISHVSQRNRSTILGFYYFASRGGSGLLMPLMGRMIDSYGFDTAFTVVGAAALAIVLCCSVFLWGSRD